MRGLLSSFDRDGAVRHNRHTNMWLWSTTEPECPKEIVLVLHLLQHISVCKNKKQLGSHGNPY